MCRHCGTADRCTANGKICSIGLDRASRDKIVEVHNELRRKIAKHEETEHPQPAAANMMELKWNWVLAAEAMQWAMECTDSNLRPHDENAQRKLKTMAVGQNRADFPLNYPKEIPDVETFIKKWYGEITDMDP